MSKFSVKKPLTIFVVVVAVLVLGVVSYLSFGSESARLDTIQTAAELIDSEGGIVPLSSGEFRLLSLFIEHPQRILSRERIMELSSLKGGGIYDRSIDTQIKRLRGKLRDDGRKPSIIVTMRGDGYMLACDVTHTS